jgi:DNA processing protein
MGVHALARSAASSYRRRYAAPDLVQHTTLTRVLDFLGKPPLEGVQTSLLDSNQSKSDTHIFYAGALDLLKRPSVAIVGSREVSEDGAARSRHLSKRLAENGVTVVSGLAKGVDVNAHRAAMIAGGRTVAVIGTPIDQAYPAEHGELQSEIASDHLLISPFPVGSKVYPANFPKRNRVMAALTDGTVIVEAGDTSGTLHQAVECEKLGRWLFILQSVYDNKALEWPKRYAKYERVRIVSSVEDVLGALGL